MARLTNGVGTWFCKAGFDAGWGWDDAVESAMFVYFPVWAHRVVHYRQVESGSFAPENYEAIPLRFSEDVVRQAFLRRWMAGLVVVGLLIALMLALVTFSPPTGAAAAEWAVTKPVLGPLAPCLVVAGIVGLLFLRPRARREKDIRRLLGVHQLGTSDPASWLDEDLARMQSAESMFGTSTYAEAVPKLLEAGSWTGAMWAARLSAALEARGTAEELTDRILAHAGAVEALSRFRKNPTCWPEAMGSGAYASYRAGLRKDTGAAIQEENSGH